MKTGGREVLDEDTQKGKVFTVPKSITPQFDGKQFAEG
jgi:hypothetical protein